MWTLNSLIDTWTQDREKINLRLGAWESNPGPLAPEASIIPLDHGRYLNGIDMWTYLVHVAWGDASLARGSGVLVRRVV